MLRLVASSAFLLIAATFAHSQNADVIKQRQAVMDNIANASISNFKMSKGEIPFDAAVVQTNLKTIQDEAGKFKALFPDNSKTGDTDATEKIWQARAEFDTAIGQLIDVSKAIAAAVKDEASLKLEYPKMVSEGCATCHTDKNGFAPRLGDSFKRMSKK